MTSKARHEIVQVLRTLMMMHTVYPTSEQYVTICKELIAKFPKLANEVGTNGFVSSGIHMCLRMHAWAVSGPAEQIRLEIDRHTLIEHSPLIKRSTMCICTVFVNIMAFHKNSLLS